MGKKIAILICALLILAVVGYYVVEVAFMDVSPTQNLARMLVIVAGAVLAMVKVITTLPGGGKKRKSLSFYADRYAEDIKYAFINAPGNRKKLLKALRFYNEDNYKSAVKYLLRLKPKCKTKEDARAVGVFLALTLTDMGYYTTAIGAYQELLDLGVVSSRIYSNLGYIHSKLGNHQDAITAYHQAIQWDDQNAYAYNNLAYLYFDTADFENAIKYAEHSLQINYKLRQAAKLLAIIYSLLEDDKNVEKYTHVAIAAGVTLPDLQEDIAYYKSRPPQFPDAQAEAE